MMELEGGTVTLRILGELWDAEAVDVSAAVWLFERVLSADRPIAEQEQAAFLLLEHASKLLPAASDADQDWNNWPALLETWPSDLARSAKDSLLLLPIKVLLAREPDYWVEHGGS
jgi:hypothetical protein